MGDTSVSIYILHDCIRIYCHDDIDFFYHIYRIVQGYNYQTSFDEVVKYIEEKTPEDLEKEYFMYKFEKIS